MPIEHRLVVHLVNVIGGHDQRVGRSLRFNTLRVLKNGVRRAQVPVLAHPLGRRNDLDKLAHLGGKNVPRPTDMSVERQRFVLRQDIDLPETRVDAIGKRDIDDAVGAGEGDGRFGTVFRQRVESLSRPAGKHDG